MVSPRSRRPPASSPTPSPRRSFWRPATRRPRSSKPSRRQTEMDSTGIVLVIDNYDSFTYNLVQYLGELGEQVVVRRNNEITLGEVTELEPVAVVLSPGPGTPGDAGICKDLLLELGPTLPTLGVCLGHQCLGEAYGGQVRRGGGVVPGNGSAVPPPGTILLCRLAHPVCADPPPPSVPAGHDPPSRVAVSALS